MVTLINTGRTVNTFQLGAITDVYSCGAHINALEAVDTIAMAQRIPILIFSELFAAILAFPTFMIIGHNNGFIIQQNTLESSVRTGNDTDLFPEPRKNKVEHSCKNQQGYHGAQMGHWTFGDILNQSIATDQIGQKDVGYQK
jgi:hypothetical protein